MSVKIMTDSTSYIDEKIIKDLDIGVLSLYVSFEEDSIRENEIENDQFYNMMEEKGIPLSSQPTLGELYKAMVNIVSKGDDLLCVFLSSEMSGTYNSAVAVSKKVMEEYPDRKIYIIDSRTNSMQLGFAAIVAARAAKEGKDIEAIKKIVKDNIKRSKFLFIPDNLKYLQKGGRIGDASALIGNILKLIPILTVKNGSATTFKTVRTKKRAIKEMLEVVLDDDEKYAIKEIIVHHIDCIDEAEELAQRLKAELGKEVSIVDIGPVIGLHVGPGAIGIAYYTREDIIEE
nr:DegV family protein [Tissierella sp.]